jgi:hypothetical protein
MTMELMLTASSIASSLVSCTTLLREIWETMARKKAAGVSTNL